MGFRLLGGVGAEWLNDVKPKARCTANFALKLLRDAAFLVGEKWCPPSNFVHFAERIRADPVCERGPKALFVSPSLGTMFNICGRMLFMQFKKLIRSEYVG